MSLISMPLVVVNVGAEMIYVLVRPATFASEKLS